MFAQTRENSIIYLLEKTGERPRLRVATVEKVGETYNRYAAPGVTNPYGALPATETYVDIDVRVDEETIHLKELPSDREIADKGGVVVSKSREAMLAEKEALARRSRAALDTMPWHEAVVAACEEMEAVLNPARAAERERDSKIQSLETEMGGIKSDLGDIKQMLTAALSAHASGTNSKK